MLTNKFGIVINIIVKVFFLLQYNEFSIANNVLNSTQALIALMSTPTFCNVSVQSNPVKVRSYLFTTPRLTVWLSRKCLTITRRVFISNINICFFKYS